MKLPPPPAERGNLAVVSSTALLAPKFRSALADVCMDLAGAGFRPILRETFRTDERAAYLYGFGRDYDDGRGIVTQATNGLKTWHRFGLAADVGDRRYEPGQELPEFWTALERAAIRHALTSGADWNRNGVHDEHFCDRPHVQWWCEGMHVTPSDHAAELLASGGVEAVWQALHAV